MKSNYLLSAVFMTLILVIGLLTACEALFLTMAGKDDNGYEDAWTVTFDPDNETPPFSRTVLQPDYMVSQWPDEPPPAANSEPETLFMGWFIEGGPDHGSRFTSMTPVTDNVNVRARWRERFAPGENPIVTFESGTSGRRAQPYRKAPSNGGNPLPYLPEEPRREGFIFAGWYINLDDFIEFNISNTVISNMIVYARWEPIINTDVIVTFNSNMALVEAYPVNIAVPIDTPMINLPWPPQREGYVFMGWTTNIDGTGDTFNINNYVDKNITLYAQWRKEIRDTFALNFNTLGGKFLDPQIVNEGASSLPLTETPDRRGYNFGGWYTKNGSFSGDWGTSYTFGTLITENTTIYARWIPKNYNIHFQEEDGTPLLAPISGIPFNSFEDIPGGAGLISPYPDHVFDGWSLPAGSSVIFRQGRHLIERLLVGADADDPDIYLIARWRYQDPSIVSLSFDTLGGSPFIPPLLVTIGTEVSAPPPPTKRGYRFDDWWTEDGTADAWGVQWIFPKAVNETLTLFAKWEPNNYTVHFHENGGSGTAPGAEMIRFNAHIPLPGGTGLTPPVNRIFDGWSHQPTGGTIFRPGDISMETLLAGIDIANPDNPIPLYAQWAEFGVEMVNITFQSEGVSLVTVLVEKGQLVPAGSIPEPHRTGHTFLHQWLIGSAGGAVWDPNVAVGADLILVANWQIRTYTLTFNSGADTYTTETINFGSPFTIPGIGPVPPLDFTAPGPNHEFRYWADGSARYYPNQIVTNVPGWAAGNVTLTAFWEEVIIDPDSHAIVFRSDGVTIVTVHVSQGSAVPTASIPVLTKPGYSLGANWNIEGGGTWTPGETITGPLTLNAIWTERQYSVTYHQGSGVTDAGNMPGNLVNIDYSSTTTIGAAPTRPGFTFLNWNTAESSNGAATRFFPGQSLSSLPGWGGPTITVNLYAHWAPVTYTVVFDSNGGTFVPPQSGITHGKTLADVFNEITGDPYLPTPTRTGYYFGDWRIGQPSVPGEAPTGTVWTADMAITESRTLYARWIANTYYVSYDANDGVLPSGSNMDSTTHTYDAASPLKINAFTRAGYTFTGWNTLTQPTQANPGRAFADGQSVINLTSTYDGTFELFAQWTEVRYTVTFNLNGGPGTIAPRTISEGSKVGAITEPDRTGYTFMGWHDGTTTHSNDDAADITVTGNINFTAQWEAISYTIRYNANGGEVVPGATLEYIITYNQSHTIPSISSLFTRESYNFRGWNTVYNPTASNPGLPFADRQSVINLLSEPGEVDLYAQWEVITHMVTFNMNGATPNISPQFIPHDGFAFIPLSTITPPTHPLGNPAVSYTFEGWTTDYTLPGELIDDSLHYHFETTPVTSPITLYAILAENNDPLTVKFSWNHPDATDTIPDQEVFLNGIISPPENVPTIPGFAIMGWYTHDGTDSYWGQLWHFTAPVTAGMTLYARWEGQALIPPQWTSTLAGNSPGDARFNATAVHPTTGDLYAVGYITGSDFNFGNNVIASGAGTTASPVIVKYNAKGEAQWARSIGGGTNAARFWDLAISIEITAEEPVVVTETFIYAVGEQQNNTTASNFDYGDSQAIRGRSNEYNPVIVKYRDNGSSVTTMWARTNDNSQGTNTYSTSFRGAAVGNDGIYAVGYMESSGTMYLGNNVTLTTTVLDEQPIMVKYAFNGNAQWAYIVTSGGGGDADARFNAVDVSNVIEDGNAKTYIYAVGYQRRTTNVSNSTFNYGYGVSILPTNADTTVSNASGHNAVIVKFDEYNNNARALAGTHLTINNASEFNTVAVQGNFVYTGGMLNHRPVIVRYGTANLEDLETIRATAGAANLNTNYGTNNRTNRNNMFVNYINSLAVDSAGNIWAAGSLHGSANYTWESSTVGASVNMQGTSASGNSVIVKINSDFTLDDTFSLTEYQETGPMSNSALMRQTRNAANTANVTESSATHVNVPRAVLLGVAVGTAGADVVVYAAGFQKNIYTYDHGNGKPTAAAGTGNYDKPVILRY